MPIGAQEWRIKTGLVNSNRHLKVVHSGFQSHCSLGITRRLPPPAWKGWGALFIMLTVPLFYKITTVANQVGITLWFGHTRTGGYEDILSEDWKFPRIRVINPFPDYSSLHTAMSVSTAVFLYLMILLKLIFIVGGAYHPAHVHIVRYSRVYSIPDPLSNIKCEDHRVDQERYRMISMFQVCATLVTALLLLLAKEVETIQKPPAIYPSTMDKIAFCGWYLDCDVSLMSETSSISRKSLPTVHIYHVIDVQLLLTGPTTSNFGMSATCYNNNFFLCVNGVLMLLLLLAGDVETNPGPSGKLTLKNTQRELYHVRAKWKNIGIQLDIHMGTLNVVDERCRGDPDKSLPDMLDHWLKQVDPPPSWEALAEALESAPVGEGRLAEEIRQKYCSQSDTCTTSSSPVVQQPLTNVLKYSQHLKCMYNRNRFVPGNKWPPSPSTRYINLACIDKKTVNRREADEFTKFTIQGSIDDICHKKTPVFMKQVACMVEDKDALKKVHPRIVLVEGAPGVGKTTFAWELCRRWAQGELLQHYSLVVLLRMRDCTASIARELVDLFPYPQKSLSQSLVDEVLMTNGEGVLILLEGFDELPEEKRIGYSSVYHELIKGSLLPSSTVLITSRPWAVSGIRQMYSKRIDQRIEILGFTRQQIDEFLISYSRDDQKLLNDMRRYVSLNPPIHAAMYIPLNTVIVCEIYKDRQNSDYVIPSTMTELYTAFSLTLLIRYLNDPARKISKFGDLPSTINEKFLAVCRLASDGISNNQQLIFSHLPDNFETLGFMQSVPELHISSGVSVSYNFLHLTIQEFLAAYYLSLQAISLPSAGSVAKFLAGITKLMDYRLGKLLPVPSMQQKVAVIELKVDSRILEFAQAPALIVESRILEFAQAPALKAYDSVTHSLHDPSVTQDCGLVFLPACAVKTDTVFSHTRPQTKEICDYFQVKCHISLEGTASHFTWLYESQNIDMVHACFGNKTVLIKITTEMTPMQCFAAGWCMRAGICEWKLYFISEEAFQLDCMEMLLAGMQCARNLTTLQRKYRICELCIYRGIMKSDPITQNVFFDFLDYHVDGIQKILVVSNNCDSDLTCHSIYTHLAGLIQKCVLLEEILFLDHFKLVPDGCSDPIRVLPYLGTLLSIDLTGTFLAGDDVIALILQKVTSLKHLILEGCGLNNIRHISEELKVNKSLETLDLSGNYLWPYGQCLAGMLNVNQTLQVLRLYECGLTQDDTTSLFKVFIANQNTSLRTLHIGDNNFHPQRLGEMISSNISLQCLEVTVPYVKLITSIQKGKRNEGEQQRQDIDAAADRQYKEAKQWDVLSNILTSGGEHDFEQIDWSTNDSDLKSGLQRAYNIMTNDSQDSVCQTIVSAMNKNTTLQRLVIHTFLSKAAVCSRLSQYHDYERVREMIEVVSYQNPGLVRFWVTYDSIIANSMESVVMC